METFAAVFSAWFINIFYSFQQWFSDCGNGGLPVGLEPILVVYKTDGADQAICDLLYVKSEMTCYLGLEHCCSIRATEPRAAGKVKLFLRWVLTPKELRPLTPLFYSTGMVPLHTPTCSGMSVQAGRCKRSQQKKSKTILLTG